MCQDASKVKEDNMMQDPILAYLVKRSGGNFADLGLKK
jgi:hypothetical protein